LHKGKCPGLLSKMENDHETLSFDSHSGLQR
jgi:hypothetical protein